MVGDRLFTDVAFGNMSHMFTIHTHVLTETGDNVPALYVSVPEVPLLPSFANRRRCVNKDLVFAHGCCPVNCFPGCRFVGLSACFSTDGENAVCLHQCMPSKTPFHDSFASEANFQQRCCFGGFFFFFVFCFCYCFCFCFFVCFFGNCGFCIFLKNYLSYRKRCHDCKTNLFFTWSALYFV